MSKITNLINQEEDILSSIDEPKYLEKEVEVEHEHLHVDEKVKVEIRKRTKTVTSTLTVEQFLPQCFLLQILFHICVL